MRSYEYLDTAAPFGFAHRGGTDGAPENSMAAFDRAVGLGYRYIETDVHRTADGVLIAFHDDRLDRVTDRTGMIRDLPWSEIRKAKLAGTEPIPRLVELFDAWPDIRINIDPKADDAVAPLIDAIRDARAIGRVCVGSFSDARIDACRDALGPELCTSPGPNGMLRVLLRSFWLPAPVPPIGCLQIPPTYRRIPLVTRRLVNRAHAMGLQVHVWTINDAPTMRELLDLGVDAIMTDELALLRSVMQDRGEWSAHT